MKVINIIGPLPDILFAIRTAFSSTLIAIFLNPSLLLRWRTLAKVFMANHWVKFGDIVDQNMADAKKKLLTTSENIPEGVVLDIGAGLGHTVKYLDRGRVTRYVALEPNVLMHPHIRQKAGEHGYSESDGSLTILSCGAEDSHSILLSFASVGLTDPQPVDTIISILTLCSVPNPQQTIHRLVRDVLKPGGTFLMFEHVLNPREDVRWWQRTWAPIWQFLFGGCRMDRDTDVIFRSLEFESDICNDIKENAWREWNTWGKEGESEECLFWHCAGRFVKK